MVRHKYVPTTLERVHNAEPSMKRKWRNRSLRESALFIIPWFILYFFVDALLASMLVAVWVGFSAGCLATYGRAIEDIEATNRLVYGDNWRHNATVGHMSEMSHLN